MDEESKDWIAKQEQSMTIGESMVKRASDEALDYITDAIENLNNPAWRKMSMDTQSLEMGVGVGIAEHLVPNIYNDMSKTMSKKLKVPKGTARALQHIYIGRLVKNIRKELNDEHDKPKN